MKSGRKKKFPKRGSFLLSYFIRCRPDLTTDWRLMNILYFLKPKAELTYLTTDTDLKTAMEVMERGHYMVVPMIDRKGQYAGILTEGDLLYNIKNEYGFDMERAGEQKLSNLNLKRYYNAVTVHATMESLFKEAMHQIFVPVTDDYGTFIGIVRRRDIIKYFYDRYLDQESDR